MHIVHVESSIKILIPCQLSKMDPCKVNFENISNKYKLLIFMNRRRPMRIDALNRNWVKLALLNIVISVSVSLIVFLSLGKSEKQSATKQFQDQVTILHQEISKVRLLVFTILPVKISSCQPISQFC